MQRHTKKREKKHSRPDLEPIGFDRVMQSNLFILIPEAIRAPLMRTLFFLYIPCSNPRGSTQSISICMVACFVLFFCEALAYITAMYASAQKKKKKYTGIEKIPGLIRLNPIHLGPKHAAFGMWLQFVLG